VGMLKAPTYYNPVANPKNALRRRNTVLGQLLKYERISQQEYDELTAKPIQLQYTEETVTDGPAPYFRTELAKWLREYLKKEYGDEYNIYTSGLKIHTTIDSRMQQHAEAAMTEIMKKLQRRFEGHWQGRVPWETADGKEDTAWFNNLVRTSDHYRSWAKAGLSDALIFEKLSQARSMKVFTWKGDEKREMSPLDSVRYQLQILQGGLIAEDPFTGEIRAWVGGIDSF
jgi:penicillin-binding protein 1A